MLACVSIMNTWTAIYISSMHHASLLVFKLLFSLEFPVLHMTAVFLVHKADDEDHIWSCEIHFGSTVEQDSKFFTFRAEFHNIEIINLYEVLTFLWTLKCSSTTAVVKTHFFENRGPKGRGNKTYKILMINVFAKLRIICKQ